MSIIILLAILNGTVNQPEIKLIGKVSISGYASDLSGIKNLLEDKSPSDRLGGFGSAIAYTGIGNNYIMLPDRGPGDGANSYLCRFHLVEIIPTKSDTLSFKVLKTTFLKNSDGSFFNGSSKAFTANNRLDPEGIRVFKDGSLLISDEYGPSVLKFDSQGKLKQKFQIPDKFLIQNLSSEAEKEFPPFNLKGRVTNKGFEGLALAKDEKKWLAAIQAPLIQDRESLDSGINCRFLEMSIEGKPLRELVYVLDNHKNGVSEILALGDEDYLVIERDSEGGEMAGFKKIFRIHTGKASDVSKFSKLPSTKLNKDTVPVNKTLFFDLLSPEFGFKGKDFPAKIEGITFGPDLPDGKKLLLISSDNDFKPDAPSWIYAFSVKVKD